LWFLSRQMLNYYLHLRIWHAGPFR
jgi:hypothetical protein